MAREIIISQRGHEVEIGDYLSQMSPGQGLILDMGGMLASHVYNSHQHIAAGACLLPSDALVIDQIAYSLAQTWHGGEAGPKYRGISVGDMIAHEVTHWLISAMKHSAIIAHLCSEVRPEALVIVDDGSPFARIVSCTADAHGLSLRRLACASAGSASPPGSRDMIRRALAATARVTYEWFHTGCNTLTHFASIIEPGFRRPIGLRCVLFDPYFGYERLIPQLFGSACARIVIPSRSVRLMPRIRYYQEIFGVPTGYFHWSDVRTVVGDASDLTNALQTLAVGLDREPPPKVPGLEVAWVSLRAAFREYCVPLLRTACTEIDTAETIIRKHGIDATVLPFDEGGLPKALVLVGRRDGLLTIRYAHGVPNRFPAIMSLSAEKLVVYDEGDWKFFQSRGVIENQLTVLSNPLVPVLESKAGPVDLGQLRRKLGIKEMRSIVLFVETPFTGLSALDHPEEVVKTLADLLEVAHEMPNSHFLIKLHPNNANDEELGRVQRLVGAHGLDNVTVLVSGDTPELILVSDVVVGETSTCLGEATVLNRPAVAFVNREFVRQVFPYGPNSGVVRVDSPDELVRALREVLGARGTAPMASSSTGTKTDDFSCEHSEYYNDPRWELLSLIPSKARRVLDVGCGAGWLGQKVKATRPCYVVGIEANADAAKKASRVLDAVFVEDIEQFFSPFQDRTFDCIVLADVLEHLHDPWHTLERYTEFLSDDGVAVLSIPNIGHYTTLLSLFRGHWEYKDEGILDRTHLRFFTREGIEDLVRRAGLRPLRILRNTQAGRIMRTANLFSGNRLADLITFQYLVVARRLSQESTL